MLCPYCQNSETKVIDKRDSGHLTRRRRECEKCGKRFSTLEEIEKARLKVIKRDGIREEFDREKIKRGIELACRKRPVDGEKINKIVMNIEDKLRKKGKEIDSSYIGKLVSRELKKTDEVAYIRFASVCRDFTNLSDFKKEINELVKN